MIKTAVSQLKDKNDISSFIFNQMKKLLLSSLSFCIFKIFDYLIQIKYLYIKHRYLFKIESLHCTLKLKFGVLHSDSFSTQKTSVWKRLL